LVLSFVASVALLDGLTPAKTAAAAGTQLDAGLVELVWQADPTPISEGLAAFAGAYEVVHRYVDGAWIRYAPSLPDALNRLRQLERGKQYTLRLISAVVLSPDALAMFSLPSDGSPIATSSLSLDFEGSGLTAEREAVIRRVVGLMPPTLFERGLTARIGNEFWSVRKLPVAGLGGGKIGWPTIDGSSRLGVGTPILSLRTFFWAPRQFVVEADGRLLSISAAGVVAHEFWHIAQRLLPAWDEIFTPEQKYRWSYTKNDGGWQLEGGPSIVGLAYGGQYDFLQREDPAAAAALDRWVDAHRLEAPWR
jgi:hypothetical protein